MMVVRTNNSEYIINYERKTISGGKLNGEYHYESIRAIIGTPLIVVFPSGQKMITSNIVSY